MIFAFSVIGGVVLFWVANILAGTAIFLATLAVDFISEHSKIYRKRQNGIAASEHITGNLAHHGD